MNKKPYIAPKTTVILPELGDLMLGIEAGSAIEVLTNDHSLDFEGDNPDTPVSSFNNDDDRLWDSFSQK